MLPKTAIRTVKARFETDNNVLYFQDFSYYRGLPSGVEFECTETSPGTWQLVAPGYGGKPYGNGKILVHDSQRMAPVFEYLWKQEHGDKQY